MMTTQTNLRAVQAEEPKRTFGRCQNNMAVAERIRYTKRGHERDGQSLFASNTCGQNETNHEKWHPVSNNSSIWFIFRH